MEDHDGKDVSRIKIEDHSPVKLNGCSLMQKGKATARWKRRCRGPQSLPGRAAHRGGTRPTGAKASAMIAKRIFELGAAMELEVGTNRWSRLRCEENANDVYPHK